MPSGRTPRRKRHSGSNMTRVVEGVAARGTCTIDDLQADLPDLTRKQIHHALDNLRHARLVRIKDGGVGHRYGKQSVWEIGTYTPSPLPEVKPLRLVPSVWALSAPRLAPAEWPPLPAGRTYALLGDWNSEAAA